MSLFGKTGWGWSVCWIIAASGIGGAAWAEDAESLTFERDIRPILRAYCLDCHGAEEKKEGGLDLRLVRFQLEGGESGPAIAPGDADASYLIQRIRDGEMPPGEAKMSAKELAVLERWVASGAKTKDPEPETIGPGIGISAEERAWWAFQPIRSVRVPIEVGDALARSPVDVFLIAAMPSGLSLCAEADRGTLLRRTSLDLLGLPPDVEEIEAFVQCESPDAFERQVDRLLASARYGERWARHWLDVAGYADSEGATAQDAPRPWAYKYRDYVIRAFNSDKGFDRFVQEQVAGDELAGPIKGDLSAEQIELLTATGFLRMAADGTGSGDNSPEARNQVVADTIKIVSTSLLGLSVACAQCHDHRYDPILHTDYYALRAVLEPALDWQHWTPPQGRLVSLSTQAERELGASIENEARAAQAERDAKQAAFLKEALEKELSKFEDGLRESLRAALDTPAENRTEEQKALLASHPSVSISPGVLYQYNQAAADALKEMDAKIAAIRARKPAEEFLRALVEPAEHKAVTHRFHRGDYRQPLEEIEPGMLSVLADEGESIAFVRGEEEIGTSGRRLAFSRWITGETNPLTARVIVNRIWSHHFGRGLVETPADFGRLGTPPTHPDLLDWLADEFRSTGWSMKRMHREIVQSLAYRQSSRRAEGTEDPENRYYSRQFVRRLDAEGFRDRVLAASGSLDGTMFGPAVGVKTDDAGQVMIDGAVQRRTVYTLQRRTQPVALLQAFDAPVMQTNCEARPSSTVATQSLMLMNGSFLLQQASRLADRAMAEPASLGDDVSSDLPALGGDGQRPLWEFGYGSFEAEPTPRTTFTSFGHWTGSSWQGGKDVPDPVIGWAMLHANGGHPGESPGYCVIRRWNAPTSGSLDIRGTIAHPSENGDGVRGRVVSSRAGLVGEWAVFHGETATDVAKIAVEAGDTIDFVVDGQAHVTSDSFGWQVQLSMVREDGSILEWDSASGFHGPLAASQLLPVGALVRAWQLCYQRNPTPTELQAAHAFVRGHLESQRIRPQAVGGRSAEQQSLSHLAQVLLSSNEFLYVD